MVEDGIRILSSGPLDYTLQKLTKAHEVLMTRFAPFKVGDRVALRRAPDMDSNHGWRHCRHFLIPGAVGTVRSADCSLAGNLIFDVDFDHQPWIDQDGKKHDPAEHYTFCLREDSLSLVGAGNLPSDPKASTKSCSNFQPKNAGS